MGRVASGGGSGGPSRRARETTGQRQLRERGQTTSPIVTHQPDLRRMLSPAARSNPSPPGRAGGKGGRGRATLTNRAAPPIYRALPDEAPLPNRLQPVRPAARIDTHGKWVRDSGRRARNVPSGGTVRPGAQDTAGHDAAARRDPFRCSPRGKGTGAGRAGHTQGGMLAEHARGARWGTSRAQCPVDTIMSTCAGAHIARRLSDLRAKAQAGREVTRAAPTKRWRGSRRDDAHAMPREHGQADGTDDASTARLNARAGRRRAGQGAHRKAGRACPLGCRCVRGGWRQVDGEARRFASRARVPLAYAARRTGLPSIGASAALRAVSRSSHCRHRPSASSSARLTARARAEVSCAASAVSGVTPDSAR